MDGKIKYSINKRAELTVGKREIKENSLVITLPCEFDYHCPICEYKNIINGNFDERLEWSEYNGFVWCPTCNKDFPSAICQPDIDKAIETYLDCIEIALLREKSK